VSAKLQVCIVGGGMITQVQILPSIYQLQRLGVVGEIGVCALNSPPLRDLANDALLRRAFPGFGFKAYPALDADPQKKFPDLFKEVIAGLPPQNIVVVAVPDQLHEGVIREALRHNQHICCVKPLVLKYDQAVAIEEEAYAKGLIVGVEYHKRFDDRSLIARRQYRAGRFGEFRLGHADLHECWYYRHSNFQNWCTCENSDTFTYIACHYIDLVHFITGLLPTAVSVYGIADAYPNGNKGFLWTDGRVIWENGACLNVQNSLGYPDDGPGGNYQGMRLFCQGKDKGAMIVHSDQFRGVEHAYLEKGSDPGDTVYAQPNPDYFQYLNLGGEGLTPVGYGYRSIEYIVRAIADTVTQTQALNAREALTARQKTLARLDSEGVMATPKNSAYNELVMEAGRLSILNGGREVAIAYGNHPKVALK
jgi:predicted dehydrogenase